MAAGGEDDGFVGAEARGGVEEGIAGDLDCGEDDFWVVLESLRGAAEGAAFLGCEEDDFFVVLKVFEEVERVAVLADGGEGVRSLGLRFRDVLDDEAVKGEGFAEDEVDFEELGVEPFGRVRVNFFVAGDALEKGLLHAFIGIEDVLVGEVVGDGPVFADGGHENVEVDLDAVREEVVVPPILSDAAQGLFFGEGFVSDDFERAGHFWMKLCYWRLFSCKKKEIS